MRKLAECQDGVEAWHCRYFCFQKSPAGIDFRSDRFVVWRKASNGICDPCFPQRQIVLCIIVIMPGSKAIRDQHLKEKPASRITCEGSSSSIGTAKTGSKSDNEQAGVEGAKCRDRTVMPVWMVYPACCAKFSQAWAKSAIWLWFTGGLAQIHVSVWSGCAASGRGGRVMNSRMFSISMNSSAIRRNESAAIGGDVLVVDTTVTRTPSP